MQKVNPYLLAFYLILAKALVFSMGWPEVVVLSILLLKLGFESFLSRYFTQEDTAPLKEKTEQALHQIAALQTKINFINSNLNTKR